jgi:hypothetical protein
MWPKANKYGFVASLGRDDVNFGYMRCESSSLPKANKSRETLFRLQMLCNLLRIMYLESHNFGKFKIPNGRTGIEVGQNAVFRERQITKYY